MPSPHRTIHCAHCGAESRTRSIRTRYCSKACAGAARRARAPLATRLIAKVQHGDPDECWPWTGARTRDGYGSISRGDGTTRSMLTHRAAYLIANGELPADIEVCHSCDNPPCCNPAHLFSGTHTVNMRDAKDKGRMIGPGRARETRNGGNKYSPETIQLVRALGGTMSQQRIADQIGMGQSHVSRILRRKNWQTLA